MPVIFPLRSPSPTGGLALRPGGRLGSGASRCSPGEGARPSATGKDGQRRGGLGTYLLRGGDGKTGCDGAVSQQGFVKLLSFPF